MATFSDCPIPGYTDSDFADDDDDGDEGLPDEKKDKQLPVEATQSMDSTEPEKNEPADSTKVTPASEPQVVGVGAAEANGPSIDATQKDKEITKALDFLEGKI